MILNSFNEYNESNRKMLDVIGVPSGEIIEIYKNELDVLINMNLVSLSWWDGIDNGHSQIQHGHTFNDTDIKKINNVLSEIY